MQCVGHGRGQQHYRVRSEQCAVLGWPFQGRSNTGGVPLDGNTHAAHIPTFGGGRPCAWGWGPAGGSDNRSPRR